MTTNPNILTPLTWETVQPRVEALLAATLTPDNVGEWLQRWSDLSAQIAETSAQIYREVSEDTADEAAEQRFNVLVGEILPQAHVAEQQLKQKLLAVEGYEPGEESREMLRRFRAEAEIFREENVPLLSELMKLGNEYDKIVGAMTIQWEGEELPIPQAERYLLSIDRAERERAWRDVMTRFLVERERFNDLFLEMLRLRRAVARNAGFDNFRDYQWQALARFDYTPDDAFAFHDAIEQEVVPLATEYYERLRDQLGVERLRPWDVKADPEGPPEVPFDNADEMEAIGQRLFEQVDPVLGQHFATMRDGYLDLASRANKAPGGYCNGFPLSGKPYIFMNAVGVHRDLEVLLHEGGHAFHFMESQRQPLIWNHNGPMEFCEVASMAMELLAAPYLSTVGGYDDAEARRARARHLIEAIFFLPYMAVVDVFQHWVYVDAPEDITATELDDKWAELWDRFVPGIDYSGLQVENVTGWHRKSHLFSVPFYYIEYGLAQLGAFQVWRNALEDQAKAVADYRAALALGDTRPLPELFRAAGARFAFDRETVGELMTLVRKQLEELEG